MSDDKDVKYHLLGDEIEQRRETKATRKASFSWIVNSGLSAALGACILLLVLYLTGVVATRTKVPDMRMRQPWLPSCGKSPEEAQAAGCIFDPMLNAWTRPECYDEELSMEFRGLRDWKFYKDQNATVLLSPEEFSRAGDSWGSWEYHISHCMFTFRKLHRALLHGGYIEQEVGSEPHTQHCLLVTNVTFHLMQKAKAKGEHWSIEDMGTILNTGYPRCFDAINLLPYDGVVNL